MSRSIAVVAAVIAAVILGGCSDPQQDEGAPSNYGQQPATSTVSFPADTTPTTTFGETLEIISEGFAIGVSDYTIGVPQVDPTGRASVDVTIATKQGECIPGSFFALADDGTKVEDLDLYEPGMLDQSGTLIAGERRQGAIVFDIPSGTSITKIVLYHGTVNPPRAYWTE